MATEICEAQHVLQGAAGREFIERSEHVGGAVLPDLPGHGAMDQRLRIIGGNGRLAAFDAPRRSGLGLFGTVVGNDREIGIGDIFIGRYLQIVIEQAEGDGLGLRFRIQRRQPDDAEIDEFAKGHFARASLIRSSRTPLTDRPAARIWAGTSDIFVIPGTGLISRKYTLPDSVMM